MSCLEAPNIAMAVYNEEKNLKNTLSCLKNSILSLNFENKPNFYICFNGCSDNSISIFKDIQKELEAEMVVHILSSPKGKLRAHQVIIENIDNFEPVIFMDADIIVNQESLKLLIEFIKKDKIIVVCSAYPYSLRPQHPTLYQKIIFPIINIKRIYPKIEICSTDVKIFHPEAKTEFEERSRIYFHGRCFIIRNKEIYKFPRNFSKIVGDDTFLSFIVLKHYPPGSIQVLYNAKIYSKPQLSIRSYLNTWMRIRKDLDNIFEEYPEMNCLKRYVRMKINWRYIVYDLKFIVQIQAIMYFFLKYFESFYYTIKSKNINPEDIWIYKTKE